MLREYIAHVKLFSRNARLFLAGTFFFGFGFGTFWVLLNLYLRELGLVESLIGRVVSFQSVGMLATALLAAWAARRYSFRRLLSVAAILSGIAYAGLALGARLEVLLPAAVLAGAGFTVHHVVAAPFFMENSTDAERMYLFGTSWATEMAASVIGIAGGGWLAGTLGEALGSPLLGLRYTLLGAACFLAFALVPYALMRETRTDSGRPGPDGPIPFQKRLLFKLSLPGFIVGFGAGLIIPFLNLYFRDRFALSTDRIGVVFAVGQVLTAVGFLVGPYAARRIGMIRTVVATELLSIPFFVTLAFTHLLPVAVFAFWMRGALMNMNHPISSNFAMEVVGRNRRALTNSILMMTWNLAWMASSQIGGYLIETTGFRIPMLVTVVLYFGSSCLYLFFFRDYERAVLARPSAAHGDPHEAP